MLQSISPLTRPGPSNALPETNERELNPPPDLGAKANTARPVASDAVDNVGPGPLRQVVVCAGPLDNREASILSFSKREWHRLEPIFRKEGRAFRKETGLLDHHRALP